MLPIDACHFQFRTPFCASVTSIINTFGLFLSSCLYYTNTLFYRLKIFYFVYAEAYYGCNLVITFVDICFHDVTILVAFFG
jgi:hypothetical protein